MKIKSFVHIEFAVLMVTLLWCFYSTLSRIDVQCERTDKLYEICVDLLREKQK